MTTHTSKLEAGSEFPPLSVRTLDGNELDISRW